MNKRGEQLLIGTIVLIIINIIFIIILIVSVTVKGDPTSFYEETFAKQTALLINIAKPGTQLEINIDELIAKAHDNKQELIFRIDCEKNLVIVKALEKSGYEFEFVPILKKCDYKLDLENRKFTINI